MVGAVLVFGALLVWVSRATWGGPTREVEHEVVPSMHAPLDVELARVEQERSASRRVPEAVVGEERAAASESQRPQSADIVIGAEATIAAGEHGTSLEPFVRAVHVSSAQRDAVGATVEFHGAEGEVIVRSTDAAGFATLSRAEAERGPWTIVAARLGECPLGYTHPTYRAGGATVEIELVPVQMLYVTVERSDGRVFGAPYNGEVTGVWLAGAWGFRDAVNQREAPHSLKLGSDIWERSGALRMRALQIAGMSRNSLPPGRGWLGVLGEGREPLLLRTTLGEADTESVVVEARAAPLANGGAFVHVVLPALAERELGTVVLRLQEPYPDAVRDLDELALDLRPADDAAEGMRGFALEVHSARRATNGTRTRFEVAAGTYDVKLDGFASSRDIEGLDAPLGRFTVEVGETVTIDVPLPNGGAVSCGDAPSDLAGRGSLALLRLDDERLYELYGDVDFAHMPLRCGWLPSGRYVALGSIDGRDGWAASLCEPGRGPTAADWSHPWLAGIERSFEDVYESDVDGEPQSAIDDLVEALAFEVVAGRVTTLAWYAAPIVVESED